MTDEKNSNWEEICRIEKTFKKQKGNETAIIIKSVEESDELISIDFLVKKGEKEILIPLNPMEWKNLKQFFNSADKMMVGVTQSQMLNKLEKGKHPEIDSSDEMIQYEKKRILDTPTVESNDIFDEINQLTRAPEDRSGSKELEETSTTTKDENKILPSRIELKDLPQAEPLREIPLPKIKTEEGSKKEIENALEEISEITEESDVDTTPSKTIEEELDTADIKIENLDELISEIAIVREIKEERKEIERTEKSQQIESIEEPAVSKPIQKIEEEIEKEVEKIKEPEASEETDIESKQDLQLELKEVMNQVENISKVSLDEMNIDTEINKSSPRVPRLPKKFREKNKIEPKKQEASEQTNEERIIKAMEKTASLLPDGPAKSFVLNMKEKRKKVMNKSQ
ncbi:MAG: hypothetical protein EU521_00505 [Promethearchaeota archaeon]|nr:MAG: hypothetical protein EU521_00505 [Candidatus Lokiarchaeota archaeon]